MAKLKTTSLITGNEITTQLGITPGQLKSFIRAGMPVAKPGGPGKSAFYDLTAVKEWIESQSQDDEDDEAQAGNKELIAARVKKLEIEITAREFDLDRLRLKYIKIDDVLPVVDRIFTTIRASLTALPAGIAQQFVGCTDRYSAEILLNDAINKTLAALQSDAVLETLNRTQQKNEK